MLLPCYPAQDVKSVAWHPDGDVLVSTSYDDTIRLWCDAGDEWTCAQTLEGMSSTPQTHRLAANPCLCIAARTGCYKVSRAACIDMLHFGSSQTPL